MSMIHGALEFYLNNKSNFSKISLNSREQKPKEGQKPKKTNLPSWLSGASVGVQSKGDQLRNQSLKLKEELKRKALNWEKIVKGKELYRTTKMSKKVKKMQSEDNRRDPGTTKQPRVVDFKGESNHQLKIIYASRTHSQIREFIKELKTVCRFNDIKVKTVHLGSRQQFCSNPNINHRRESNFFAEMCQSQRERKECPFYNFHKVFNIPQVILVKNCANQQKKVRDIEDLKVSAKSEKLCGYYVNKYSCKFAEVVCIPYSYLFSPESLDSFGLDVTNAIVLFDEAHNLLEFVANSKESKFSLGDIKDVDLSIF